MGFNERHLSAIDRARIAYDRMVQRQREVALDKRRRGRSRLVTVITTIIGVLMLLGGTAIYYDWIPTPLRTSIFARSSDDGKFNETRTGQVRSFVKGNTCQELQFNNERGVYVGGNLVPCETVAKRETPPPQAKGARVNSIRDAFTGR